MDEPIQVNITVQEAVALVGCCNTTYLKLEAELNLTSHNRPGDRTRLRNKMTRIQEVKEKIKTACIKRGVI